ncbi:cytochrome P450 [Coprinopsis cinerea okayama7|uniref:Cytochrome P450 n=1 Tax=Coprinopsis cinerea (strain Okayama-7 / 130 / ATCC MYA-4618 / FGSC 9003) TaxID=240176 RepID=A8NIR9_COPC7|nr:cytochrome P450 [Coprinopsis cinerea okayama7\|eukprot:XP_001834057.2 cytochrome P450 [Coprinopsis cinerea okayama7\
MTSSTTFSTLSFVLSLVLFITFLFYRANKNARHHLPPGPKGLPFIGNVLQMPSSNQVEAFKAWANEYGDLVYVQIFGQPMVILDSLQVARDLLDKRSSIYSDRPRFVLFSELMGWHSASTHVRYGPRFRKHRRFMNQIFNSRAISAFRPLQHKETLTAMEGLLNSPDSFVDHFRRFAASTILKITYGHEVHSADDRFVQLAERAATMTVQSGSPAATLVDFFPVMRHIPTWAPFSSFKRKALETRKAVEDMMEIPFQLVKQEMKSGVAIPSYTSSLLESRRNPEDGSVDAEDEEDIKGSAGTLYAGESLFSASPMITSALLHTFVLAMVLHPDVLKKVQTELDQVVGNHRLPTLEDRPSLPYFECVLKEVLRWNPLVPLGMPHRLMDDDYYRDYLIPKNSTVLVNIYSILRDCPNSDAFYPERYLEDPSLPDPKTIIFGFGRRVCPGRFLADASVFMILTTMVTLFDISKSVDSDGREIVPEVEYTEGFVRHPKPFNCTIKPRSSTVAKLISQAKSDSI